MLCLAALFAKPSLVVAERDPAMWQGWRASLSVREAGDAGSDLYNGVLWFGGLAAVELGTSPPSTPRFRDNSFDRSIRDSLRIESSSGRSTAATASDVLMIPTFLSPLVVDSGLNAWARRHNRDQAFDLATDWVESISLTLLVTQATKVIAGRERPHSNCFRLGPPCGDEESRESFFSGHSSTAAAGAGLMCANSIKRRIWGDSLLARALPCALGAGAAIATGFLRIAADEHWGTDVFTGWVVGAAIGWFDVPGPFDLLRFDLRGEDGHVAANGRVLPYAGPGAVGAQVAVHF
jgi:membrane-associated phospholipid phosphatase